MHRLPQGQLLLHLLPAQGRLPPHGGRGALLTVAFGLWPCGQRPSPGPLCLFPLLGLLSKEVKRVFSRGLEAASVGPVCSLLGLCGGFHVKEGGGGRTSHTATRVAQPLPGQGRTVGP